DQRGSKLARVTNNDDLRDEPARLDQTLDSLRRNVLSAACLDQVLLAIRDNQEPIRIDVADVSGPKPAVGGERLFVLGGAVVVALHNGVALDEALSVFGDSDFVVVHHGADRAYSIPGFGVAGHRR